MKLTRRGGDYLKACAVAAIISTILDVRIALALAFAMALSALASQILLATSSGRNISIRMEDPQVTVFKGEHVLRRLVIVSRRKRFVSVEASSVEGPEGVDISVVSQAQDSLSLSFVPHFSGRFQGIVVTFELRDALQLFRKRMVFAVNDFTLNSLPNSLTAEVRVARPMALALGERAGRTRGSGQEFYAVDEYHPETEKKDILWKKVARLPGDHLVARIRESNIPKALRIALIRTQPIDAFERKRNGGALLSTTNSRIDTRESSRESRAQIERLTWIDRACEGAGALGKMLISIGCDVELVYASRMSSTTGSMNGDGGIASAYALDLQELSRAIMEMSTCAYADLSLCGEMILNSDICITGTRDLENETFAREVSRKPALLIEEEGSVPASVGEVAILYSGTEDVSRLIYAVVSR